MIPGSPLGSQSCLTGRRVLVVEDEMLVAMLIEELVEDLGCVVVGPFANLTDALKAAEEEVFDLAILDVNLRGERVYPVAEVISARNIPFLLLSGYGQDAIPDGHPTWRACSKPFQVRELTRTLEGMLPLL